MTSSGAAARGSPSTSPASSSRTMSTVKKSRLLVAISSLAIFSLMIATPAQADASDSFDDAANAAEAEALSATAEDFLDFGDTISVETQVVATGSAGYKGIVCTGQLDTTHYSKGGGGSHLQGQGQVHWDRPRSCQRSCPQYPLVHAARAGVPQEACSGRPDTNRHCWVTFTDGLLCPDVG